MLKQMHRKLQRMHHPDRGGHAQEFNRVQDAYDTIIKALDAEDSHDVFEEIFRDIAKRARG